MSNAALRGRYETVDWGTGSAIWIAAPPRRGAVNAKHAGPLAPTARARRWAGDLHSVLGATPTGRRVLVGWSYLQPDGPAGWNRAALDRCDRALDNLLAAGHQPVLTLLDHDLPDWLDERGGWLTRQSALRFADYAAGLGRRLGDRVTRWVTSADLATPSLGDRLAGMVPPSRGIGMPGLAAVHHVLLGHGLAVCALRGAGVEAEIGATVLLIGGYPATEDPADQIAARTAESWANRLFLDPLLLGRHLIAEDGNCPVESTGRVRDGDLEIIATPQDAVYLSWYSPIRFTTAGSLPWLLPARDRYRALNDLNRLVARLGFAIVPFDGVETGEYGWPVLPEALADAVAGLTAIYGTKLPPLRIVDNGMSDGPSGPAGHRRALLAARLGWLGQVMACGVPIRGYEYWSILDNVEWLARYARLYSISESADESVALPAMPCDWAHSGSFAPASAATAPETRTLHIV